MSLPVFHRLVSFIDEGSSASGRGSTLGKNLEIVEDMVKGRCNVWNFLDSGAFSAWSLGKKVNIDDYIAFIHKHKHLLKVYANLDVIGDPVGTAENQRIMEEAGLQPLPVVHNGSPDAAIKILVENYDYFAVGGMVGRPESEIRGYCKRVFKIATEIKQEVKIHGFGLTTHKLMREFPFFSVDSTTWLLPSKFGTVALYDPRRKRFFNWQRGSKRRLLKYYGMFRDCFAVYDLEPYDLIKVNWRDLTAATAKGWMFCALDIELEREKEFHLYLAGGISGAGSNVFLPGVIEYIFSGTYGRRSPESPNNRRRVKSA
jgi:hypothetical protein